ncbi:unnamed protein product [Dicrocoelium dendriticum]|nr:unnamed protein product [Dicrocoelium dendriticum]
MELSLCVATCLTHYCRVLAYRVPFYYTVLDRLLSCSRSGCAIRSILDWEQIINNHLVCGTSLTTVQLQQLSRFLSELAPWCQRMAQKNVEGCVFCRSNQAPFEQYVTHKVKDRFGRVACPMLRQFICPICGATGDTAHTLRYCPKNSQSGNRRDQGKKCRNAPGPSVQLIEAGLLDHKLFSAKERCILPF